MSETAKSFWHSAGYIPWFTADTASAVGAALRALAISLLGYAVSGSTIAAGWLGTSSMIAQQVASVFGGTFVDRHDRKRLIVANAVVGVLAWGAIAVLLLCGALSFPVLLLIAVLASGINGFLGSATDAMLRSIIDIRYYPKARSLNEGRDATIAMAGSPIGGFLYSIAPWLPFLASACMYAVAGVAATRVFVDHGLLRKGEVEQVKHDFVAATGIREHGSDGGRIGETDGDAVKGGFFRDFLEGWSWSLHRKTLVIVLIVAALVNFGVNGIQYAIQLHLVSCGTNATLIGFISGGISLTMLVGSLLAGKLSDKVSVGPTVCLAYLFICLCALPMALTDNYWVMLVANSFVGLPFPLINAMLLGFIFAKSPTSMQGRITVTLTVPAQVLSMFCSAVAGTLLPVFGFHGAVLVFLAVLVASAVLVICSRSIRSIPKAAQWEHTMLR